MTIALRSASALSILLATVAAVPEAYAQPAPDTTEAEGAPSEAPGPGEAGDPGAPEPVSEADKRKAAEFYQEAERLFGQELYSRAIDNYRKAYDLYPSPAILYNIAKSWERLGDADACVEGYRAYLEAYEEAHGKEAPDALDVRNSIAKCRLGARVQVTIGSKPSGAAVYIDDQDKQLGQTPYTTRVEPGDYTVYLDLEGYQPLRRSVTVRAGEPLQLVFELQQIRRVGTLRVRSNIRGATVFIDGRNIGLTPYDDDIEVSEGRHQVTVSKDEYLPVNEELVVEADESYEVKANLWLRDPPKTWKSPVGYTSMGLGVALGVGGFLASRQADQEFAGTDEFERWERMQFIGYGLGGGLIGVGVLLVVLDAVDKTHVKPADALSDAGGGLRWTPVVGAGGDGAVAGARLDF